MRAGRGLRQTRLRAAGRRRITGQTRGADMRDVSGLCVCVSVCVSVSVCVALSAALLGGVGAAAAAAAAPASGYCSGSRCYAAFRRAGDFGSAQLQCAEQSGHLMTVRSPESSRVVAALLGNSSGRFWIGLQRLSGCPDAAAGQLRGYEWITKDGDSAASYWSARFDGSCAAPRCVSVSARDQFRWTQDACAEPADGFLCEYGFSSPCSPLDAADGETVTYWTPMGFGGDRLLSLPPGSTATRMPAETKYVCFSDMWLLAPWTCEILEGGCEYRCAVDPANEPSCYCPPGQTVNPRNHVTCEPADADADPCVRLRCEHVCYDDGGGSRACACDHGFRLAADGRSCVDFNDCTDARQCPEENQACVNTVGGFQCVCRDGYRLSGGRCVDVNECVSAPCEHRCVNTDGGYECACYDGYRVDEREPSRCELHCGAQECEAQCDPNDRFQCYCPDGYISEERGNLTVCLDMDECSFGQCDQLCKNWFGGYTCSCEAGFALVGEGRCVPGKDADGEGSGGASTPSAPAPTPVSGGPTRQPPRGVSAGGLVGIIVCTVVFTLVVVFLVHHFACGRAKPAGGGAAADKAAEGEGHTLRHVTTSEAP